jgi:hypothetical protein
VEKNREIQARNFYEEQVIAVIEKNQQETGGKFL